MNAVPPGNVMSVALLIAEDKLRKFGTAYFSNHLSIYRTMFSGVPDYIVSTPESISSFFVNSMVGT